MSTARTRVRQRLTDDRNREWLRAELARRRLACLTSHQQRRDGIARLARTGLFPVALPSLNDAFDELKPPCL